MSPRTDGSAERLTRRTCATPLGTLTLVASDSGLRQVLWDESDAAAGDGSVVLDDAAEQLARYFDGELRSFDLPLDLVGTEFQLAAWHALVDVPYGSTLSYGQQAWRLSRPRGARAVGSANGRNPVPIVLPCHRLVGADGSLVGFGGGLARKRMLLEHEAAVSSGWLGERRARV